MIRKKWFSQFFTFLLIISRLLELWKSYLITALLYFILFILWTHFSMPALSYESFECCPLLIVRPCVWRRSAFSSCPPTLYSPQFLWWKEVFLSKVACCLSANLLEQRGSLWWNWPNTWAQSMVQAFTYRLSRLVQTKNEAVNTKCIYSLII